MDVHPLKMVLIGIDPYLYIYIYTKSIIYSHVFIHWFNRVLHGHCQDMRVFRVFRFFRQLANWAMMILDSLKSLFGALILLGLWEAVYGGYMGAIWGLWVWGCCENVGIGWLDCEYSSLLWGIRSPQRFSDGSISCCWVFLRKQRGKDWTPLRREEEFWSFGWTMGFAWIYIWYHLMSLNIWEDGVRLSQSSDSTDQWNQTQCYNTK